MADVILDAIRVATAPLIARIAAIEAQKAIAPRDGRDGLHGKDVDLAVVKALVVAEVAQAVSALPPARDGRDGKDGKDGASGKDGADGAIGPRGEKGAEGAPGKDGANGLNGKDGSIGPAGKDGAPGINGKDGAVGAAGKDGAPGLHGKDGTAGVDGRNGAPGLNGKDAIVPDVVALVKAAVDARPLPQDGRSVTLEDVTPLVRETVQKAVAALPAPVVPVDALIERDGTLVLMQSDGGTKRVGVVVGKDGRDGADVPESRVIAFVKEAVDSIPRPKDGADGLNGKDGADGVGFDDMRLDLTEDKGFVLRFVKGDAEKAWPLPIPHYEGTWQSGRTYVEGAAVTVKGAIWIATKNTKARPGEDDEASRDWKLCVKAGRDGKNGGGV